MTTIDNTHNGWTNYETWHVNLDMFDGWDMTDFENITADQVQCIAEDHIEFSSSEGFARDYAMTFLSDVNWSEIADHLNDNQ
jgi:hypothetical protein